MPSRRPAGAKTYEYMLSCRTKLCQLLCLKNRGRTSLRAGSASEREGGVGEMGIEGADNATHFENSVGLGQVKVVPSDDQWIKPVVRMSSSSSME
jgi:hypothetical protein